MHLYQHPTLPSERVRKLADSLLGRWYSDERLAAPGALPVPVDMGDAGTRQEEAAGRMPAPRGPGILPGASVQTTKCAESIGLSVLSAPGRLPFAEARLGTFRPAREGERFGPRWSTHWFKLELEIPAEWQGREVHLRFQSCSEALVWSAEGQPLQGLVSANWAGDRDSYADIRSHHRLTQCAAGGERVTLFVEASITSLMGFGMAKTRPELTDPGDVGELKLCRLASFDRAAWDLYHDLRTIDLLGRQLPENHLLRLRANTAGNAIANALNVEERATWPAARQLAARFFADNAGARRFNVSAIGHAHIDTAWLWTIAETIGKCARSFTAQLRLIEDYPEHKFACSQAQQLAWVKQHYPQLFADLQTQAAAGHFLPCGGTWIEPDVNLPSGESLVRQFLLGQRFYQREFGRRCREFWNPDVFGYSAAMPQILRGAGIESFLTQKLSWNQFNKPLSSTFLWEGLDGSRVLTHFPPADTYNGNCEPGQLFKAMDNHKDAGRCRESYYLFGYGDGGGGPTASMLESLRRQRALDGMPAVDIRGPEEFFTRLADDTKDLHVWSGELYFEMHRGTYTTQAANKRDNRRAEESLHDAEFLSALASASSGAVYPHPRLTRAWELTCLNQFHDIIPGSSIHEVYQDSARDYAEILTTAAALRDEAIAALWPATGRAAENLLVLNTLTAARREVVDTASGPRMVDAPPLGYAVRAAAGAPANPVSSADSERNTGVLPVREDSAVSVSRAGGLVTLDNGLVRAVVDGGGRLVSFRDLRAGRECIAPNASGNQFVMYEDKPLSWDAWDVDIYHLETARQVGCVTRLEITSSHPLQAKIEVDYTLTASSTLKQTLILRAGSPLLEFVNTCDWHEQHQFLKVEFPLALRSDHATYEIQFGHVRRPTHFNTSWDWARFEVCAHRWADLSEPDFGVAVLNDSKYGYACHANVLRLSLLRAPVWPDPYADRGRHEFRYGLLPHAGGPQLGGVIPAAAAFNQPLHLLPSALPVGESCAFFAVDHAAVVIDTVKVAEDSADLIVRLYESHGSHARATLSTVLPVSAARRSNLLEDPLEAVACHDGKLTVDLRPFEILTLQLSLTPPCSTSKPSLT